MHHAINTAVLRTATAKAERADMCAFNADIVWFEASESSEGAMAR